MTASENTCKIGLLGFGEAASAFASGWDRTSVGEIRAYDIKIDDNDERPALEALCAEHGVMLADNRALAFSDSNVVFSLVSADQAFDAAAAAAREIRAGTWFVDGNSCSPQTKTRSENVITAAGGRYIDMAIMAPVHPLRAKTPVLIAGRDAPDAKALLELLGMAPRIAGDTVGAASAIKLTRSIMIKGMEALFAECILSARLGGVEEAVLASLEASDPDIDWRKRAAYSLDRMTIHGRRRAAEMRESANMIAELGLPNDMTTATTCWEQLLGDLPVRTDNADDILAALGKV